MWRLSGDDPRPLYKRIQTLIVQHIQSGRLKPGQAIPSYPELAKALRVADRTVRQAYSELQRAGVLRIERGRGSFVAEPSGGVSQGSAKLVGVLTGPLPVEAWAEGFFWAAVRGVHEGAAAVGSSVLFGARGGGMEAVPGAARAWDGAVVVLRERAEMERFGGVAEPAVWLAQTAPQGAAHAAGLDYEGAGRELGYRLVGLGHKHIGLLRVARSPGAEALEAGYRHALGAAALPVQPKWVTLVDTELGETGLPAAMALIEQVSAVVVQTEDLARTAWDAAVRRGLAIPEALSLAAVVERPPAPLPGGLRLEAALLDAVELGRNAVRWLWELMAGRETEARQLIVEAQRLEGDSVSRPREGGT